MSLPAGVTVFERGWLSANNILLVGPDSAALVDSGYATHAALTTQLVSNALAGRPLDTLVSTHLHSDHCGANAALQARYPGLRTLIPPGQAAQVEAWDPVALTYSPTGQHCPRFTMSATLHPGERVLLGQQTWDVLAAPGHDPHSVMLFERASRTLVSADALWENGFGVVFPEIEGVQAFDEVGATLDVIESIQPKWVIPGHGAPFSDAAAALLRARERLVAFKQNPKRHGAHAAKVLIKFKLLELQSVEMAELLQWAGATPYLRLLFESSGHDRFENWFHQLVSDLTTRGAARLLGSQLQNN